MPPDTIRPAAPPPVGGGRDLTSGPIGMTLILFALPVLGANVLQALNGSANAVWVSHVLGEAALAATANANQIFFLMIGAVFGFTMAANIMIAQAIGAGDRAQAKTVVGTSITLFLLVALGVAGGGGMATPHILLAMGTPADATANAIAYLRVILLAMPFLYIFMFLQGALRGTGDSRTPFYFALMIVVLDVILNPLLIIGVGPFPRLGIAGSATATLVAHGVSLAALLTHLYRTDSVVAIRPSEWRMLIPNPQVIAVLLGKGLPMAAQMSLISLAAVTMISFVNAHGVHTAAAYGVAVQLWTYVQMPAMAMGAAVTSMAAQNVGAGRFDRLGRVARSATVYVIVITGVPILALVALDPWILQAFLPHGSPSLEIARHINLVALWTFLPFGVSMVLFGVIRSTGAVWPPLIILCVSLWGLRVQFARLLAPVWGADAIWWSFPASGMLTCLLALAYYRWGGWRKAHMLRPASPRGDAADTGLSPPAPAEEAGPGKLSP